MTIAILKTEPFQPLGPAIPKPAPAAPQSREIKPGIWQAPDGKLRTDFATGQSVAPAQKAAPVAPLPTLPNALCDGWISFKPGLDIPCGKIDIRFNDGEEWYAETSEAADPKSWSWKQSYGGDNIVAYRLIP